MSETPPPSNFEIFHSRSGEFRLTMIDIRRMLANQTHVLHFNDLRNDEEMMKLLLSQVAEYRALGGTFQAGPDMFNILSSLDIIDKIPGAKAIPFGDLIAV